MHGTYNVKLVTYVCVCLLKLWTNRYFQRNFVGPGDPFNATCYEPSAIAGSPSFLFVLFATLSNNNMADTCICEMEGTLVTLSFRSWKLSCEEALEKYGNLLNKMLLKRCEIWRRWPCVLLLLLFFRFDARHQWVSGGSTWYSVLLASVPYKP